MVLSRLRQVAAGDIEERYYPFRISGLTAR